MHAAIREYVPDSTKMIIILGSYNTALLERVAIAQ